MTDSRAIEGLCEFIAFVSAGVFVMTVRKRKSHSFLFLSKKEKLFNFQHSLNGVVLPDSQPNVSEKVLGLFCCESVVQ